MGVVEMVMRNALANLERDIPLLERSATLARQQGCYAIEESLHNAVFDCKRAHGNLKRELEHSFRPGVA